jgi:hypothetical protein
LRPTWLQVGIGKKPDKRLIGRWREKAFTLSHGNPWVIVFSFERALPSRGGEEAE